MQVHALADDMAEYSLSSGGFNLIRDHVLHCSEQQVGNMLPIARPRSRQFLRDAFPRLTCRLAAPAQEYCTQQADNRHMARLVCKSVKLRLTGSAGLLVAGAGRGLNKFLYMERCLWLKAAASRLYRCCNALASLLFVSADSISLISCRSHTLAAIIKPSRQA